jgi:cytochrome c553
VKCAVVKGLAVALVASLGACVGEIAEDGAGGTTQNQKMFASTVDPLLRAKCAGCHEGAGAGPAFLGAPDSADDYVALLSDGRVVGGFETSALLLTKGSHQGVQWWTAEQESTITAWLVAEAATKDVTGTVDVMAQWAGCMTIENWNASKMAMWAQKQTDQNATCGGCHADGEYGFHANPTSDIMFAQQRTAVGISSFFQVSAAGDTPSVAPAVDKLRSKCSGANLHPACAVDDQYVDYLNRFYQLTRSMLEAGLCDEPGYQTTTTPTGP